MVLSQFCTFTVFRAMSITSPSAPTWGISIQSPTRNRSLDDNCTPAVNDKMVSLNTSISTADMAPRPDSKIKGERSTSVAKITMPPSNMSISLPNCT